jgi:hypothetical protein
MRKKMRECPQLAGDLRVHALRLAAGTVARHATSNQNKNTKHIAMKIILTLAALLVSASFALAAEGDQPKKPGEGKGDGKRPNPEEFFKKLDANSDGSISKDEFMAGPRAKQDPAKGAENFGKLDKDSDGKLSKEEFMAMAKGKGDKGKGDGKGKKPEAK